MKKTILIIIVLISVNLNSLEHGLIMGFKIGNNDKQKALYYSSSSDKPELSYSNITYIKTTLGYRIEGFKILGSYNNNIDALALNLYAPIQDSCKIKITYTWKDITFGFIQYNNTPKPSHDYYKLLSTNEANKSFHIEYYKEF